MKYNLKTILVTIFTTLTAPIFILNIFGGIISGIWLGVLGEWRIIGVGIILALISTIMIPVILMPGMLFGLPALWAQKRNKKILMVFFLTCSVLYAATIITLWCLYVFSISVHTGFAIIPMLIWSYGIALGPWMWLANKDQGNGGNESSRITTFFAQFSYIIAMVMFLFDASPTAIIVVFGLVMLLGSVLVIYIACVDEFKKSPEDDGWLDEKTFKSLFDEDGHVLVAPMHKLLSERNPENRFEFVKDILKNDPLYSNDETKLDEITQFTLNDIDGKHENLSF